MKTKVTNFYSTIKKRYSFIHGETIDCWTLMLPGAGCQYYKQTGGCTMCGFHKANRQYTHGVLYPPFIFMGMYKLAKMEADKYRPTELRIFNGGSFFNDQEIPRGFQDYIFKEVAQYKYLTGIFVESRVEYITDFKIKASLSSLDGEKLTVGIGLESSDEYVRNVLIEKGLRLSDFEKSVRMIQGAGGRILAYVFLKPLGLDDKEALDDTLKTIKYCLNLGIDEIDISCAFIQEGTKMAEKYLRNEYQPPTLWPIIEIIRQSLKNNWPVSIGGFGDEPRPIAIPANNCPDNCSETIYKLIDEFRVKRKFNFQTLPNCSCRSAWS